MSHCKIAAMAANTSHKMTAGSVVGKHKTLGSIRSMKEAAVSEWGLSADSKAPGFFRSISCSNVVEESQDWLFTLGKKQVIAKKPVGRCLFRDL